MKFKWNTAPALLIASTLAVVGLVFFQLKWIAHSRKLSEEAFNQRVCMALCSTVEHYGGGANCTQGACSANCNSGASTNEKYLLATRLIKDTAFLADLKQALSFYQIDLAFNIRMTGDASEVTACKKNHQCMIAVPASTDGANQYITLDFPGKDAYVLGKMNAMVLATILILLFTAAVLLIANWSLHKQERVLRTNVDFFNNMAHEFRTPLTNIALAGNMLAKKNQALKDDKLLDIIQKENTRLLTQVERVLHLASLESGDFTLQKERIPLRALLQSVCDDMSIQIEEKQAVVLIDKVPGDLEVYGDRVHLASVFRNLLDNALKYSGAEPQVRIAAQEQGHGILISVQDNGIGIPAAQCDLIFEKFQRVHQGDLHEQKGFGLGLAFVKRMVELHKGFVKVNSEPEHGSRFEVYLPTTA